MQIQYNITRIEEWCKSHEFPEGVIQLEHLMQTAKLLQFKKASLEDIENIYDVCWILSPTQIQKLISQYYTADYENPIRPEILRAVAEHVLTGDKSDVLLLDSVPIEDTSNPFEIPAPRETKPESYLPSWVYKKNTQQFMSNLFLCLVKLETFATIDCFSFARDFFITPLVAYSPPLFYI